MAECSVSAAISARNQLINRFIYLNNVNCEYTSGNLDTHLNKKDKIIQTLDELLQRDYDEFYIKIRELSQIPKQHILFGLALAMKHNKVTERSTILGYLKTDDLFFDFVQYSTQLNSKKISKSLKNIIVDYYISRNPINFAKSIIETKKKHGWSHKDLIKLCHIKSTECTGLQVIIEYLLFGIDKVKNKTDEAVEPILKILIKADEFKRTEDATKAIAIIKEFNITKLVNIKLQKSEPVWAAIIEEMNIRDILQMLIKLHKMNMLKRGSCVQEAVLVNLANTEKIKASKIHPIEIFIYLKNFEKGGKPLDSKYIDYLLKQELKPHIFKRLTTVKEPKCPAIITQINKCLIASYDNVKPYKKRFMIVIDITNDNTVCMNNKNISALEAMYALIHFIMKLENNTIIAIFKDSQIQVLNLTKNCSFIKFTQILKEEKSSYCLPHIPFKWAGMNNKKIDIFLHFLECDYVSKIPPDVKAKCRPINEALRHYSQKMNSPETKLVRVFLGGFAQGSGVNAKNVLTIQGFSKHIPNILENFINEKFT